MCDYCEKEKKLDLHRQFTDTNIQEIFLHTERDAEFRAMTPPEFAQAFFDNNQ